VEIVEDDKDQAECTYATCTVEDVTFSEKPKVYSPTLERNRPQTSPKKTHHKERSKDPKPKYPEQPEVIKQHEVIKQPEVIKHEVIKQPELIKQPEPMKAEPACQTQSIITDSKPEEENKEEESENEIERRKHFQVFNFSRTEFQKYMEEQRSKQEKPVKEVSVSHDSLKEKEEQLKRLEQELAQRESQLKERELALSLK